MSNTNATIRIYRVNPSGRVMYMGTNGKSTSYHKAATFDSVSAASAVAETHGWVACISITA